MATSRGVKLALLASRGQLNDTCPPELVYLLNRFKFHGLDIDIAKDYYLLMANHAIANKDDDSFNKHREAYLVLFDPTHKNEREAFMKQAQEKLKNIPDDIRIRTNKNAPIKGEYNLKR